MSNTYGISEQDEQEIRKRDKKCVYCRALMKQPPNARGALGATIEHFNNDGDLREKINIGICCRRCNSSKGTKTLSVWFKAAYCRENKISRRRAARAVERFMRRRKGH